MKDLLEQGSRQIGSVSDETVSLLRIHGDALSEYVTEKYFERHPECRVEDRPRIRRLCKEDLNHHLGFIQMAAASGNGAIFVNYVAWLRKVLESRGLSMDHPDESLRSIRDYLNTIIQPPDSEVLNRLVDLGLQVLEIPSQNLIVPEHHSRYEMVGADDYAQAIVSGNRQQANEIATREMAGGVGLVDLSVGVIQPAMYQLGNLWQANRIGVAQEHMATAITQNVLAQAFMEAEFADPIDRVAVLACVPGNHHSLGLRMVSDALETIGWRCEFLGADTPVEALISFVDEQRPDMVALSVSMPEQVEYLSGISERLESEFAGKRPDILAGGLMVNALMGLPSRTRVDEWFWDAKQLVEEKE